MGIPNLITGIYTGKIQKINKIFSENVVQLRLLNFPEAILKIGNFPPRSPVFILKLPNTERGGPPTKKWTQPVSLSTVYNPAWRDSLSEWSNLVMYGKGK